MSSRTHRSHASTNVVANPLLIRLLRSGLGRRPGRRLAVVDYTGRRTGRPHRLVAHYARHDGTVRIEVGRPADKTWWRNFEGGHPLRLRLAGRDYSTTAYVAREGDRVSVVARLDGPLDAPDP